MTTELAGEATIVERADIEAARRPDRGPRPFDAGRGDGSGVVRHGDAARPQARADAAHGVVQAAGSVQQDARVRRAGGGRRGGVRRQLRAGGRVRRARARSSCRDLRPRHVAGRQDRPHPRVGRGRAGRSRVLPRGVGGRRTRARPRPARSRCTRSISRRSWPAVGRSGCELSEQVPDVDTVLVAVAAAGSIAGIASWLRGDVRVVGVEPEACPTLHPALEAGEPVDVEVGGIAADSLGPRRAGRIAFAAARDWVDRVVPGVRRGDPRGTAQVVARHPPRRRAGGAASLAALLADAYRPARGAGRASSCAARTPIRRR